MTSDLAAGLARLEAAGCAVAYALQANQNHAHQTERLDLATAPLVDAAYQRFVEAVDDLHESEAAAR